MQDPKSSTQAQTNRESCLSLVTAKDFYLIAIPLPNKKALLDLQMHHPLSDGLIAQFRGEIPLPFFIAIMEALTPF